MRKFCIQLTGLLILALLALPASQSKAGPQAGPRPAEALRSAIEAKLKCGVNENGKFFCQNVQKQHGDDNSGSKKNKKSNGSKNICKGPNDCGPGYRDLEKPSRYGACCEEVKSQPKDDAQDEPKSGKCQQVEKMSDLSCRAPFDAYSCGPVANGMMTCCCVK